MTGSSRDAASFNPTTGGERHAAHAGMHAARTHTIGITGHQQLADERAWVWVDRALTEELRGEVLPFQGVSSLASGTDQHFASIVLRRGGSLIAVVPFADYATRFDDEAARANFERLRAQASIVEVLERHGSDEEAYLAAGQRVVDLSDVVIAVWDGATAKGLGGTGDVVAYARARQKAVIHLDPITCRRMAK